MEKKPVPWLWGDSEVSGLADLIEKCYVNFVGV
jgi:hypothetical protein